MSRLLVALVLLSAVFAEKERVSDEHIEQITDKLVRVLEKRLNEWGLDENDGLTDADDACAFNYNNGSIIRTQDSINAGASFIKAPEVSARESCEEICCDIANCNLAVYKDKGDETSCYLFDCGSPSVCLFTTHPGFVSMEIPQRQSASRRHEADLESLVAATTMSSTTSTAAVTTTTAPTTTTTAATTTETAAPPKQPVPLFGECKTHKDCAGSATECLAAYCVCQEGYHAQEGSCHHDKVDKDDDEEDNTGVAAPSTKTHPTPDVSKKQQQATESKPSGQFSPQPGTSPAVDSSQDSSSRDSSSRDHDQASSSAIHSSSESSPSKPDSDSVPSSSEPVTPAQSEPEPDSEETEPDEDEEDDGVIVKDEDVKSGGASSSDNSIVQMNGDGDGDDDTEPMEEEEEAADSGIDSQAMYIGKTMKQNQSAVIALALGLVLTVLLLFFVGCRLRNMKRRLRKGRPLNSNEADYLINGMYL